MVFFWLKEDTDVDEFIQGTKQFLDQIKEVNTYFLGKPANTYRDIVDRSYTVSLVVTFDSIKEHDIYQEHTVHKQYVTDNSDKWTRVQVFDADNTL